MSAPTYRPEVFRVRDIEDAKRIILTGGAAGTTDDRWRKETPYLAELLTARLSPTAEAVVLDYGCGIGRLAKELIARTGCTVIGVDISAEMRSLAHVYVEDARLATCSPAGLLNLVKRGLRVDHAYTVWVLQHCLKPEGDVALIAAALRPGGSLCLANSLRRWVPTDQGWKNDGIDVLALVRDRLDETSDIPLDGAIVGDALRDTTYFKVFRRRRDAPAG